ncbi:MAG: membrane integrity-associated transporter subunit PqiC [Lentisphaeria bacterium]|nr:membrane integrity-associated transporter subunit PqiC [Lentisphaeria bacterium]
MKRFGLFLAAAAASLLASCHFSLIPETEFSDPKTFDLASPAPVTGLPFVVDVETFSSECAGRFKMVFREDENRISVDEYNRWSMPPGAMLTKYLSARFAAAPDSSQDHAKPLFSLDGTVLICELNVQKKQVSLMIHFIITEHTDDEFKLSGTKSYSIPVDDVSAESFAEGMNKAAGQFADDVVKLLKAEMQTHAAAPKAPAPLP